MGTEAAEARQIRKNILMIFVLWVVANHSVKFFAPRVGNSDSWLSFAAGSSLRSLDEFRRATGDVIGGAQKICPDGVAEYCRTGMGFVREVLGVK